MAPYMGDPVLGMTLEAMQSRSEEVALQGIEFWSTVCEKEAELETESEEGEAEGEGMRQGQVGVSVPPAGCANST